MGYIIEEEYEEVMLDEGDIVISTCDGFGDILELLLRYYQRHVDSEATAETIIEELRAHV